MRWTLAGVAVVLAAVGGFLLVRADAGLRHRHTTVEGVPVHEVRPAGPVDDAPGAVVAHGFSGSARLMLPFADSLARRGFVVVLFDFGGHGANLRRSDLESDVDIAVRHLRSLPDVDPARVFLAGHSMGAIAVTRYAANHPEIAATMAVSLPEGTADRLLVVFGALELPRFHRTTGTRVVKVPMADHVLILYAPRTHEEMLAWFGAAAGPPPTPWLRALGATLLLVAFGLGIHPLASISFKPILILYAIGAATIPIHLGVTHAVPTLPRLVLAAAFVTVSSALAYGCVLLTCGRFWRMLALFAAGLAVLTAGAAAGVVPGFLLLVLPLLAVLLTWQAAWTAVLVRSDAPRWLAATVGAVLPAVPAALALPFSLPGLQ